MPEKKGVVKTKAKAAAPAKGSSPLSAPGGTPPKYTAPLVKPDQWWLPAAPAAPAARAPNPSVPDNSKYYYPVRPRGGAGVPQPDVSPQFSTPQGRPVPPGYYDQYPSQPLPPPPPSASFTYSPNLARRGGALTAPPTPAQTVEALNGLKSFVSAPPGRRPSLIPPRPPLLDIAPSRYPGIPKGDFSPELEYAGKFFKEQGATLTESSGSDFDTVERTRKAREGLAQLGQSFVSAPLFDKDKQGKWNYNPVETAKENLGALTDIWDFAQNPLPGAAGQVAGAPYRAAQTALSTVGYVWDAALVQPIQRALAAPVLFSVPSFKPETAAKYVNGQPVTKDDILPTKNVNGVMMLEQGPEGMPIQGLSVYDLVKAKYGDDPRAEGALQQATRKGYSALSDPSAILRMVDAIMGGQNVNEALDQYQDLTGQIAGELLGDVSNYVNPLFFLGVANSVGDASKAAKLAEAWRDLNVAQDVGLTSYKAAIAGEKVVGETAEVALRLRNIHGSGRAAEALKWFTQGTPEARASILVERSWQEVQGIVSRLNTKDEVTVVMENWPKLFSRNTDEAAAAMKAIDDLGVDLGRRTITSQELTLLGKYADKLGITADTIFSPLQSYTSGFTAAMIDEIKNPAISTAIVQSADAAKQSAGKLEGIVAELNAARQGKNAAGVKQAIADLKKTADARDKAQLTFLKAMDGVAQKAAGVNPKKNIALKFFGGVQSFMARWFHFGFNPGPAVGNALSNLTLSIIDGVLFPGNAGKYLDDLGIVMAARKRGAAILPTPDASKFGELAAKVALPKEAGFGARAGAILGDVMKSPIDYAKAIARDVAAGRSLPGTVLMTKVENAFADGAIALGVKTTFRKYLPTAYNDLFDLMKTRNVPLDVLAQIEPRLKTATTAGEVDEIFDDLLGAGTWRKHVPEAMITKARNSGVEEFIPELKRAGNKKTLAEAEAALRELKIKQYKAAHGVKGTGKLPATDEAAKDIDLVRDAVGRNEADAFEAVRVEKHYNQDVMGIAAAEANSSAHDKLLAEAFAATKKGDEALAASLKKSAATLRYEMDNAGRAIGKKYHDVAEALADIRKEAMTRANGNLKYYFKLLREMGYPDIAQGNWDDAYEFAVKEYDAVYRQAVAFGAEGSLDEWNKVKAAAEAVVDKPPPLKLFGKRNAPSVQPATRVDEAAAEAAWRASPEAKAALQEGVIASKEGTNIPQTLMFKYWRADRPRPVKGLSGKVVNAADNEAAWVEKAIEDLSPYNPSITEESTLADIEQVLKTQADAGKGIPPKTVAEQVAEQVAEFQREADALKAIPPKTVIPDTVLPSVATTPVPSAPLGQNVPPEVSGLAGDFQPPDSVPDPAVLSRVAAAKRVELAADYEKWLKENWNKMYDRITDPALAAELNAMRGMAKGRLDGVRQLGMRLGQELRDFAFINYKGERNNFDNILGMSYSYPTFYAKTYRNFMVRSYSNPASLMALVGLRMALRKMNEDRQPWQRDGLWMPDFISGGDEGLYLGFMNRVDPLGMLLGTDYADPEATGLMKVGQELEIGGRTWTVESVDRGDYFQPGGVVMTLGNLGQPQPKAVLVDQYGNKQTVSARTDQLGSLYQAGGSWGPTPHSAIGIGLGMGYSMAADNSTDSAEKARLASTAQYYLNFLSPANRVMAGATNQMGIGPAGGVSLEYGLAKANVGPYKYMLGKDGSFVGSKFDWNEMGYTIAQMVQADPVKYPPEQALLQLRQESGPIFEEAVRLHRQQEFGKDIAAWIGGGRLKPRDSFDVEVSKIYEAIGVVMDGKDAMTPEQYRTAWIELEKKHPGGSFMLLARAVGSRDEERADEALAWATLSALPPRAMKKTTLDAAGISQEQLTAWYESKGDLKDMDEQERAQFMAGIMKIISIIKLPTLATKEEYVTTLNSRSALDKELAATFPDTYADYIALVRAKDWDTIEATPDYQAIRDYEVKRLVETPELAPYYASIEIIKDYVQSEFEAKQDADTVAAFNYWKDLKKISGNYGSAKQYYEEHPEIKVYEDALDDYSDHWKEEVAAIANRVLPEADLLQLQSRIPPAYQGLAETITEENAAYIAKGNALIAPKAGAITDASVSLGGLTPEQYDAAFEAKKEAEIEAKNKLSGYMTTPNRDVYETTLYTEVFEPAGYDPGKAMESFYAVHAEGWPVYQTMNSPQEVLTYLGEAKFLREKIMTDTTPQWAQVAAYVRTLTPDQLAQLKEQVPDIQWVYAHAQQWDDGPSEAARADIVGFNVEFTPYGTVKLTAMTQKEYESGKSDPGKGATGGGTGTGKKKTIATVDLNKYYGGEGPNIPGRPRSTRQLFSGGGGGRAPRAAQGYAPQQQGENPDALIGEWTTFAASMGQRTDLLVRIQDYFAASDLVSQQMLKQFPDLALWLSNIDSAQLLRLKKAYIAWALTTGAMGTTQARRFEAIMPEFGPSLRYYSARSGRSGLQG